MYIYIYTQHEGQEPRDSSPPGSNVTADKFDVSV